MLPCITHLVIKALSSLPDTSKITNVKVDLWGPSAAEVEEIFKALAAATARLPALTVTIGMHRFTPAAALKWLQAIGHMRGLTLDLQEDAIPAAMQQPLRGLQGLTLRDVKHDSDLSFLSSIVRLTDLGLEYTDSTEALPPVPPVVFQLTQLQELFIQQPLAPVAWQQLAQLQRLRSLRAKYSSCDTAGLAALAQLPELEELALGCLRIAADSTAVLPQRLRLQVSGL